MIEASSEETLDRSPEEVFDFLADSANEAAWNADVISVEQVSPGPAGPGSVRRGEYRHIGRIESTIVDYERPRRLGFRAVGRQAELTLDFRFDAVGGGTRMRVHGTLALKGPLRLAEGGLRGVVTQQYAERARAIKRALDGRPG
ncbi:MAG: SRPBCC family protein [Frankiaceae bacterium]